MILESALFVSNFSLAPLAFASRRSCRSDYEAELPMPAKVFALVKRLARYMAEQFSQPQFAKSSSPVDFEESGCLMMPGISGKLHAIIHCLT